VGDTPQRQEESKSSAKNIDNNTHCQQRPRDNSEIEQRLENEPTRDATKMEISRTTRME
jgi:hypothetical protein